MLQVLDDGSTVAIGVHVVGAAGSQDHKLPPYNMATVIGKLGNNIPGFLKALALKADSSKAGPRYQIKSLATQGTITDLKMITVPV